MAEGGAKLKQTYSPDGTLSDEVTSSHQARLEVGSSLNESSTAAVHSKSSKKTLKDGALGKFESVLTNLTSSYYQPEELAYFD